MNFIKLILKFNKNKFEKEMFSFFNNYSNQIEEEKDIDIDIYEDEMKIVYTILDKNIPKEGETTVHIQYGKIDINNFINIPCWAFNRPLDINRKKELKKEIIHSKNMYGVVSCALLDNKLYLIDGQHRQSAIIDIMETNMYIDFPIYICVYIVNNDIELIDIFKKINNTKPLDPRETPNVIIMNVIKKLQKDFSRAIKTDGNRTIYPYILGKELNEKLKILDLEYLNTDKIYNAIFKINNKYMSDIDKIPNIRKNISPEALKRAIKSGFYLGLDEKFSWICQLENLLYNKKN